MTSQDHDGDGSSNVHVQMNVGAEYNGMGCCKEVDRQTNKCVIMCAVEQWAQQPCISTTWTGFSDVCSIWRVQYWPMRYIAVMSGKALCSEIKSGDAGKPSGAHVAWLHVCTCEQCACNHAWAHKYHTRFGCLCTYQQCTLSCCLNDASGVASWQVAA